MSAKQDRTASRTPMDIERKYVFGKPAEEGKWTPSLPNAAIERYDVRDGWYIKVGKTVCVGFSIKANCNAGHEGTVISIGGLPFVPWVTSAGGGICSGAYINTGYNFQCYVAETNGNITMRSQPCNNGEAANLETWETGFRFPVGGGEIILSGTIIYTAI